MEPNLIYPFNARSFFTELETRDIGGGIVLWRGYFQSVRPAVGRMVINFDMSTGAMYIARATDQPRPRPYWTDQVTPTRLRRDRGFPTWSAYVCSDSSPLV